jgi:hypothetical protein
MVRRNQQSRVSRRVNPAVSRILAGRAETPSSPQATGFEIPNVTNEAKRLLKTKGKWFPTAMKAKRYLKTKELFCKAKRLLIDKAITAPETGISLYSLNRHIFLEEFGPAANGS